VLTTNFRVIVITALVRHNALDEVLSHLVEICLILDGILEDLEDV
jgi:hypothetical protein